MTPKVSGTREWSSVSANCVTGCSHGCRYCYARYREVVRFRRVTPEAWRTPQVRQAALDKRWGRVPGVIMFPTSHDITPETSWACLRYLENMLAPGNQVLIVSKPHLVCVEQICRLLNRFRDQCLLRFTIGADDDDVLGYWEPGAPSFGERFRSLQLAHNLGWQTSVSVEPMLDSRNVVRLGATLSPYVTETIWIGKLNELDTRVEAVTDEDRARVEAVRAGQTDDRIREIYEALRDHPQVRWKESIKAVVGLPDLAAPPVTFGPAPAPKPRPTLFDVESVR